MVNEGCGEKGKMTGRDGRGKGSAMAL